MHGRKNAYPKGIFAFEIINFLPMKRNCRMRSFDVNLLFGLYSSIHTTDFEIVNRDIRLYEPISCASGECLLALEGGSCGNRLPLITIIVEFGVFQSFISTVLHETE